MVNPTGHPPAGSGSSLQLQAVNSETQRFLGQQVGKVIEARVIQVLTQLPAATGSVNNAGSASSTAGATNPGSTGNTALPANLNAATSAKPSVNPAERYQLLLSIGNQRSIKVESSLAPRIGQLLQLAVIDNQQLRIVSPGAPAATNANAPAQAASGPSAAASGINATALKPGELAPGAKPPPPVAAQNPTASAATVRTPVAATSAGAVLAQALRDALPRQTAPAELPSALAQLAGAIAIPARSRAGPALNTATQAATQTAMPAPAGSRAPLASPNPSAATSPGAPQAGTAPVAPPIATSTGLQVPAVQAAAQQLARAIPQAATLGDPAQLRAALLNSGAFYEHKLAEFAAQQRTLQNALQSAGSSSANNVIKDSGPAVTARAGIAPLSLDARARDELHTRLQGDIKGHVLTLASALKSALPLPTRTTLQPSATTTTTTPANTAGADPRGEIALANVWQVFSTAHSSASLAANTETDPIMQLLRLALGNSARIQTQQLLAVGSQFASQSDPQINQSLNLELPLWLDQRLAMVEVRIDREKANRAAANKVATWNVRLRFDLEELGELTALATLQGKRMAAVLWASAAGLTQQIQQELAGVSSQLSELGLEVQHLQCRTGSAPEASSHSAINVLNMNLLDTQS